MLVTRAALLLLAGLLALGCGPSKRHPVTCGVCGPSVPGAPSPRRAVTTPEGVLLRYPTWLDAHPADYAAMLDELRDVVPEADPRIPVTARGVPSGVTLIVLDPGAYFAPYSPTLLAAGEWRAPSTIFVAWRGTPSGPRLPALPHELRHHHTKDPLAGH